MNTNKKYELKEREANGLCRIVALKSFGNATKGDTGGYVLSDTNLSHEGNCWVYDNAQVYGNALVYDNACVYGDAQVCGNAHVYGNARVYGDACVYGDAQVYDNARVYGNAHVYGGAQVYDNVRVYICLHLQQFSHNITATNTHAFIGCEGHTWEHWEDNIETIGKNHDYSTLEINQIRKLLLILREQINAKDQ